jgi:6-pyruvoyltetrahydropterin/6-carboxytetrahydropterin synthase
MYQSSKTFRNFPVAHRRWQHQGHCSLVHGYSREFTFWFRCQFLQEKTGFVMDFGDLKDVKAWLTQHFDHTLLIDEDDPLMEDFLALSEKGACKLITYPDVGMEGTAKFVYDHINPMIQQKTGGRVWIHSVECRENDKNSAIYIGEDP